MQKGFLTHLLDHRTARKAERSQETPLERAHRPCRGTTQDRGQFWQAIIQSQRPRQLRDVEEHLRRVPVQVKLELLLARGEADRPSERLSLTRKEDVRPRGRRVKGERVEVEHLQSARDDLLGGRERRSFIKCLDLNMSKEVFLLRITVAQEDGWDAFYLLWALCLQSVRTQWSRITLMQTNREDVGRRYKEILLLKPKNADWARTVSEPFRKYFTTLASARTDFLGSLMTSGYDYIASARSVGSAVVEEEEISDEDAMLSDEEELLE